QLMLDAHFSDDELAFLRQAKSRSDALAVLESRAMHAVQGRFLDERGRLMRTGPPDLELARRLVNGSEYHEAKAEIMTPIHDFLGRVESRTAAEVLRLKHRGERLHRVAIVGLGTAVALGLVSFALLASPRVMARFRLARPVSGATPMARGQGRPPGQALWTAWPLLAAGATACAAVLILCWWLSESIEERIRGDIRDALETVHQATARSVDDWLSKLTHEVGAWARSPLVRDVVTSPGTGRQGRELLTPLSSLPSFAGYLVLDPAGRIIISDDTSLLTRKVSLGFGEGLGAAVGRSPDDAIVVLPDDRRPEPGGEVTFPR